MGGFAEDACAAASGDAIALDSLFRRHLDRAFAFARVATGAALLAREQVDDLVQSACRELLVDFAKTGVPDEGTFSFRLCLEVGRKIKAKARHHFAAKRTPAREHQQVLDVDSARGLAEVYRTLTTPSQEVAAHELIARIEQAFAALEEVDQLVVWSARILELRHADTARNLGISEAAVRSRLSRALTRMSKHL